MTRREWLSLAGCAALAGCQKHGTVRGYRRTLEDLHNPERGFYVQHAAENMADLTGVRL